MLGDNLQLTSSNLAWILHTVIKITSIFARNNIQVTVKKIAPDSPASSSGVLAYDDIHMYAVASDTTIDEYQLIRTKPFASVLSDLERAQNSKRHLILLIRGYGPSTRV